MVGFASLNPPYIALGRPIRDNTALFRFELDAAGVTAFLNYRLAGNVMTLARPDADCGARARPCVAARQRRAG